MSDNVNHPNHYTFGDVECIDAIRSALGDGEFVAYCQGNAMKYLWRHRLKGGIEDLEKAKWYIDRMIETEREIGEGVEWYKRGGVFIAPRSAFKEEQIEAFERANPAIGKFCYGKKPNDEM